MMSELLEFQIVHDLNTAAVRALKAHINNTSNHFIKLHDNPILFFSTGNLIINLVVLISYTLQELLYQDQPCDLLEL